MTQMTDARDEILKSAADLAKRARNSLDERTGSVSEAVAMLDAAGRAYAVAHQESHRFGPDAHRSREMAPAAVAAP